jgi:hypothetical protein
MGRPKGAKNKSTAYREMKQRALLTTAEIIDKPLSPEEEAKILTINGADYIDHSLVAMGEALGFILSMARREENKDKRRGLYQDVTIIAAGLAPYRFPRLASIHTAQSKQSALERVGSVEQEEYDALMLEIAEKGVSREALAYITKPAKSGNGSGGNGGVANR